MLGMGVIQMKEISKSINKGEKTMKKSLLIFALAIVLAFSLATTAGAVYRGWSPSNPTDGTEPGYVSWKSAVATMDANNTPAALKVGAHGGYITATTKCAVCHSAHRATGIPTGTPSRLNQLFLTPGGGECVACHAPGGGQGSGKLVEWGPAGGPHANRACGTCHTSGIHGAGGSKYHVMNAFMLGDSGDAYIDAEKAKWAGQAQTINVAGTSTTGAGWWENGTTPVLELGGMPAGVTANQFAAAKGIATAYTCSGNDSSCHYQGVFANVIWGTGYSRYNTGTANAKEDITGHALPGLRTTQGTYPNTGTGNGVYPSGRGSACGPCHPGNTAGMPNWTNKTSRMAYGCDQCHDMVGVATDSTAFPHGNRGIKVYEWDATGQIETDVAAGNLWMYSGNVARAGDLDATTDMTTFAFVGTPNAGLVPMPAAPYPSSAERAVGMFADPNWKVLTNVTGGQGGSASPAATGLMDGACVKCHIPIDKKSLDALGIDKTRQVNIGGGVMLTVPSVANYNGFHWWRSGDPLLEGTWNTPNRLFLYK
jgi:hypothetical protein